MVDFKKPVAKLVESPDDTGAALSSGLAALLLPEMSISGLISTVAALAMVFGGVFPFIPQYRDIHRSQNAEGFSLFVCLTLLIANILRILFWFGKHFEMPLLLQSIIMTFTMLALTHLCVTVKHKSEIIKAKQHNFSDAPQYRFLDFEWEHFWKWTSFESYIQFTLTFTGCMGLLTYIFLDNWVYVETIGFLAVFAEAMLGAPQFYRNFQNKSTKGMSKKMVAMWTCGDVFKTCYFVLRQAPAQFWICGSLQVMIDISIFIQVFVYRNLVAKPAVS
ncbi:solute carrier family 66 member 2-like isoform X1 [Mercenaria mercenaria]|uniref:solute carrier family 66 member 2-like isoform X1 n=1 Tax=Mercenaria mercenaria TaxID=6596 RepID=UPI00234F62C2|nr:solute carrier family 66 member 2-like isoform X1 [Mercenaria mercenaria]XP_053401555.1 solute carrier family 66 member 2-like isoform X1 [Mercenaria mercenaria]